MGLRIHAPGFRIHTSEKTRAYLPDVAVVESSDRPSRPVVGQAGEPVTVAEPTPGRVCYHVCVTRPPRLTRHEFYVVPLRERLPTIRIPLRHSDPDVALDLQRLIDQCYECGRYGSVISYTQPPQPPLPEEEAAWAGEVLSTVQP